MDHEFLVRWQFDNSNPLERLLGGGHFRQPFLSGVRQHGIELGEDVVVCGVLGVAVETVFAFERTLGRAALGVRLAELVDEHEIGPALGIFLGIFDGDFQPRGGCGHESCS